MGTNYICGLGYVIALFVLAQDPYPPTVSENPYDVVDVAAIAAKIKAEMFPDRKTLKAWKWNGKEWVETDHPKFIIPKEIKRDH